MFRDHKSQRSTRLLGDEQFNHATGTKMTTGNTTAEPPGFLCGPDTGSRWQPQQKLAADGVVSGIIR